MKNLHPVILLIIFCLCGLRFSVIAQDIKLTSSSKKLRIVVLNQNIELGLEKETLTFRGSDIKTGGDITLTGEEVKLKNIEKIECKDIHFKSKHVVIKNGKLICNVLTIDKTVEEITVIGEVKIFARELKIIEDTATPLTFSKKGRAPSLTIILKVDADIKRGIILGNKLHYVITKEK